MDDPSELLETCWGLRGAHLEPLDGGINSETWLVQHREASYVAKRVPASGLDDLVAGCEVAARLADTGFPSGAPVPAYDGRLVVTEHAMALLEHVPGRALDGESDQEQCWIATSLAAVHRAGDPAEGPSTSTFMEDWLHPGLPCLQDHPWLLRSIQAVRAETDPLTLTWTTLHTDPAPEAFIHHDSTGATGLIDWAGARRGPVLYDVASAVMYLGGADHAQPFLRGYLAQGTVEADELHHLDAFRRFREVVQGAYFARRLATNDLTGGVDRQENEKGLADARRRLDALGLDTA